MKTNKGKRILSTVPVLSWWLSDKFEAFRRRSRAKRVVYHLATDSDSINPSAIFCETPIPVKSYLWEK